MTDFNEEYQVGWDRGLAELGTSGTIKTSAYKDVFRSHEAFVCGILFAFHGVNGKLLVVGELLFCPFQLYVMLVLIIY